MPQESTRVTVLAAGMTCGILLALSVHMLGSRFGTGLPLASGAFQAHASPVGAALNWWAIAGAGFLGSFLAGLAVQDLSGSAPHHRRLRLLIGGVFFLILAAVPFLAASLPSANPTRSISTDLIAFALAGVTAFCGGWFAMPR
jgi:hypothetical protein